MYSNENLAELSHAQLIQLRQRIGMIFQHFLNLMSAKTVCDNIAAYRYEVSGLCQG